MENLYQIKQDNIDKEQLMLENLKQGRQLAHQQTMIEGLLVFTRNLEEALGITPSNRKE